MTFLPFRTTIITACLSSVVATAFAAETGLNQLGPILRDSSPVPPPRCVTAIKALSAPGVLPNRKPGPLVLTSGNRIAISREEAGPDRAIYISFGSPSLDLLTEEKLVAPRSASGPIALVTSGSELALFYQTPDLREVMQRLTLSGDPIGAPIRLFPSQDGGNGQVFAIKAKGDTYAILRSVTSGAGNGVWLTLLKADGTFLLHRLIDVSVLDVLAVDLDFTPDGLGIVWFGVDEAGVRRQHFATVDPSIGFVKFRPIPTSSGFGKVAFNGSTFLIVLVNRSGPVPELRAIELSSGADILGTERLLYRPSGMDVGLGYFLWTGSEYALSYYESAGRLAELPGEYRLRLFDRQLRVQDDFRFSPDPLKNVHSTRFPFIAVPAGYVTGVERTTDVREGSESFLISRCPFAATIHEPRALVIVRELVTYSVDATGGVGPYTAEWDFGDGSVVRRGLSVSHAYAAAGEYEIRVRVLDAAGSSRTFSRRVTAASPGVLGGVFEVSPLPAGVGSPLVFRAVVMGGVPPYTYQWNFGDGTTGTGDVVNHRYAAGGRYVVTLTLRDAVGTVRVFTSTVEVIAKRHRAVKRG